MFSSDEVLWMVIVGFIISFALAFGIGANDVANSFGTSVGSKVLTLKQACILATIFEMLGSILIGAKVSGTIRKGILDPLSFVGSEQELMLGYVSALAGCCIWLIVATVLNLPVSGTHSIVGATIGMALVSKGLGVIQWMPILTIVLSWFISPVLSGLVSVGIFLLIRKFILRAASPLNSGLRLLPLIYTLTILVNVGGILEAGPPLLKLDKKSMPWWGKVIIAAVVAIATYLSVYFILVPRMRVQIEKILENNKKLEELELKEIKSGDEIDSNKKTITTQVDYIALIIAQDPAHKDLLKNVELIEMENQKMASKAKKKQQKKLEIVEEQLKQANNDHSKTVHGFPNKSRKNRRRLDSAPSFDKEGQDLDYNDDVNYTLSGYLHTIHSFRQYALTHRQPHLPTVGGTPPSKATNNDENVQHKVPLLTKLFSHPSHDVEQNEEKVNNDENVGRFKVGKAKVEDNNELKLETISKAQSKDSIDNDDADAQIEELPVKKEHIQMTQDALDNTDTPEAAKLFSFLQILTAIFGSFAHGGNDVSNSIGPLIGLYLIYQDGKITKEADTPEWILFYGGVGISVGLWVLGRRVIKTIGEDLTKITPSSGFVIELASAMTVLVASLLQIPVSTTHCKVGSVVFTGRVRAKQSVDWSLFRNIIIAWIVTVPVTGSIAAGCQALLKAIFIKSK